MTPPLQKLIICNREFTEADLAIIRQIMHEKPEITRTALSRQVCDRLGWYRVNGQRKDMSCRDALRRLEKMGLLTLPASTQSDSIREWEPPVFTPATALGEPIDQPAGALEPIELTLVSTRKMACLWKEYMHRYHYLAYKVLAGAQLRYFIQSRSGLLGAISFSAAAWKIAPRDQWIGWNDLQRQENLPLIVSNSRFLIFPWVKSKNLASKVLALAARQLPGDWQLKHGYQPVLLETFVETKRFAGTCYKAAGWIDVGQTQGRGKCDRYNQNWLPIKKIFMYPLCPDFRQKLYALTPKETPR